MYSRLQQVPAALRKMSFRIRFSNSRPFSLLGMPEAAKLPIIQLMNDARAKLAASNLANQFLSSEALQAAIAQEGQEFARFFIHNFTGDIPRAFSAAMRGPPTCGNAVGQRAKDVARSAKQPRNNGNDRCSLPEARTNQFPRLQNGRHAGFRPGLE